MAERRFLDRGDFVRAQARAEGAGFTIQDAHYDGVHFGYWTVEVDRKGVGPRL